MLVSVARLKYDLTEDPNVGVSVARLKYDVAEDPNVGVSVARLKYDVAEDPNVGVSVARLKYNVTEDPNVGVSVNLPALLATEQRETRKMSRKRSSSSSIHLTPPPTGTRNCEAVRVWEA